MTDSSHRETHLEVPAVPFWPNPVVREDSALLDRYASAFVAQCMDDPPDPLRFLFGDLPLAAFDQIFEDPIDELPSGEVLWLFHLSGYLGGVWLRSAIDRAAQTSRLAGVAIPPTREGFEQNIARAARGIEAAASPDSAVLEYNRASLYPSGSVPALADGLIENFGYNQGYLLEILESPPDGLVTPPGYRVSASGPLSCTYERPRLGALQTLRPIEQALADPGSEKYVALATEIVPLQQAAEKRGREVWSTGLSVQGFAQAQYRLLLDVSSSFLQDVQAAALATAKAVVEDDVAIGRRAAIADAAMGLWLSSYAMGLIEGRSDGAAPRFVDSK